MKTQKIKNRAGRLPRRADAGDPLDAILTPDEIITLREACEAAGEEPNEFLHRFLGEVLIERLRDGDFAMFDRLDRRQDFSARERFEALGLSWGLKSIALPGYLDDSPRGLTFLKAKRGQPEKPKKPGNAIKADDVPTLCGDRSSIFRSFEELAGPDMASRRVGARSLVEFCRKVIFEEARRIINEQGQQKTARLATEREVRP